jgi:hypothetical protein
LLRLTKLASPHTLLIAERHGHSIVLKPLADKARSGVDSLLTLDGRLADPAMTFRR